MGLDLTADDVLAKLTEATYDLDVGLVVSNAGAMTAGDFLSIDRQTLLRDLRLNVQAHLDLTHHFGQHLAQRGRGGLLLVASTTGLQGVPFAAEYAASEARHAFLERMSAGMLLASIPALRWIWNWES